MTFLTRIKFKPLAISNSSAQTHAILASLFLSLSVAGSLLSPLNALAQAYPNKPIRLVCPFLPVVLSTLHQEPSLKNWPKT